MQNPLHVTTALHSGCRFTLLTCESLIERWAGGRTDRNSRGTAAGQCMPLFVRLITLRRRNKNVLIPSIYSPNGCHLNNRYLNPNKPFSSSVARIVPLFVPSLIGHFYSGEHSALKLCCYNRPCSSVSGPARRCRRWVAGPGRGPRQVAEQDVAPRRAASRSRR